MSRDPSPGLGSATGSGREAAEAIRVSPRPWCPVCGAAGRESYAGLRDRLCSAPGHWRAVRCREPGCGVLWLDPAPLEDDLPRGYAGYFTHVEAPVVARRHRFAALVRRGYLALKYGAHRDRVSRAEKLAGVLLYASPLRRLDAETSLMSLPVMRGGRVLDVGCGRGDLLVSLARAGWHAEGIDPDAEAVGVARGRGLDARVGTLAGQAYPSDSFDAITMSHVIEHVADPRRLLLEAARILRPGGRLAILTPNGRSIGHRWFGSSWFALEPPRHLSIFTLPALRRLVEQAGLAVTVATTVPRNIPDVVHGSRAIARTGRYALGTRGGWGDALGVWALGWVEWAAVKVAPLGEEVLLVAERRAR